MLMKSLEQKRPTKRSQVPKWDLSLVLRYLTGRPFEPLHEASLKHLTEKTVFLVGLASAKRVGELHALTSEISHTEQWKSVAIAVDPAFIAKTQDPGDPSTCMGDVRIQALTPSVGRDLPDRTLCPVRALRYYMDRTKPYRQGRRKLFLSITDDHKEVSKDTISRWIKQVISQAHSGVDEEKARLVKCSAHELRAIATSLAFKHTQNLRTVMAAASWRSHSTFSQFYLRDVSFQDGELSSLGPIIASQTQVQQNH